MRKTLKNENAPAAAVDDLRIRSRPFPILVLEQLRAHRAEELGIQEICQRLIQGPLLVS